MNKKPGRPTGTTKHDEKKTENFTIKITPTAKQWLEKLPKGWLADWVETRARHSSTKSPHAKL